MADVTLAVRARKWLEDPATEVDDVDRAILNALLAIATAQRETAKEIRLLSNRIEQCFDEAFGLCRPGTTALRTVQSLSAEKLALLVSRGEEELKRRGGSQ